jgi:hypothetical protein
MYMYGDEVANGYDELQDVQDYQKCFEYEINKRLVLGKTPVAIDKDFAKLSCALILPLFASLLSCVRMGVVGSGCPERPSFGLTVFCPSVG